MRTVANNPNRRDRQRSERAFRGGLKQSSRSWFALTLLVSCLLVLCAALGLRSDKSGSRVVGGSNDSVTSALPDDAAPLESMPSGTSRSQRRPAGTLEPAPAVVDAAPANSRPATLVFGELLDDSGTPLSADAKARISVVDRCGRSRTSGAGPNSAFAISALEFGSYSLTASADGFQDRTEMLELRPDWPHMRRNFSLQRAVELKVYVKTPDGKNLIAELCKSGAPLGARLLLPVATRESLGERFDDDARGPDSPRARGRFRELGPRETALDPQCMGVLSLEGELPVWVSLVQHDIVLQSIYVGVGAGEANFELSAGDLLKNLCSIRAQVIDATTRLPIPSARVTLSGGTHFDSGVATDARGWAMIAGREPGSLELQVRLKGYEQYRQAIDARPGQIVDLGILALESERTVEGRVLDDGGRPLAVTLCVGSLDPVEHSIHWFRSGESASRADGSFTIGGLGRGEFVLRCGNSAATEANSWEGLDWVSGDLRLDTRVGSIAGLELRVQRAVKLVIRAAEARAGEQGFRLVDEGGVRSIEGALEGAQPRPLALPSGNYRVFLLDPRGAVVSECVVTLGLDDVEIDLRP